MNIHKIPILGFLLNLIAICFAFIAGICLMIVAITGDRNINKIFADAMLEGLTKK